MARVEQSNVGSGGEALPEEQQKAMRKAIVVERISVVTTLIIIALVFMSAGQSQAMQAAWIEDSLALLPSLSFLIAARLIRRRPTGRKPYGHHRAIGVAHVVTATALLVMGAFLVVSSAMSLINMQKPPIGLRVMFGQEFWSGWLMVAVMVIVAIPPFILGRIKLRLSKTLHDKVLYADADMDKADWTTSVATIAGVLGVGLGLWWMDSAAAIVVGVSILKDGIVNLRASIEDLTDARAMTHDEHEEHPLIDDIEELADNTDWVDRAAARVRELGHLFHVEMFIEPRAGQDPSVEQIADLRDRLRDLDWKIHDVVIAPVEAIPEHLWESARTPGQ